MAAEGSSKSNWPGSDNVQVVEMPIIDRNKIKLNYNLKQFFCIVELPNDINLHDCFEFELLRIWTHFILCELSVNPRPAYLPPAIPADLSERIQRLHGDPIVWWIGQFIKYMLRPQSHLKAALLF